MRVDDRPESTQPTIKLKMRGRVRRRPQPALDLPALKVDNHHVRRPKPGAVYAAGRAGQDSAVAVQHAGIAEIQMHEAVLGELPVRLAGLSLQFGKHDAFSQLRMPCARW